jgi:hypothetical protein
VANKTLTVVFEFGVLTPVNENFFVLRRFAICA